MSAIAGLSTNILKYMEQSDLQNLVELLNQVDTTITKNFIEELEYTINLMSKILLLEGVNPNYDVYHSVENTILLLHQIEPLVENETVNSLLNRLLVKLESMYEYLDTHIMLNVDGETYNEKLSTILKDFNDNSETQKALSKYYNTCLNNTYMFKVLAKKRVKFPDNYSDSIPHCCILPEELADLLHSNDLLLKTCTVASSFLEFESAKDATALVRLFMYINNLGYGNLAKYLNIPIDQAKKIKIQELSLIMQNIILISSMQTFSTFNSKLTELLDIPTNQLIEPQSIETGYILDRFTMYNKDFLTEDVGFKKILVKWWKFYAYYNSLVCTRTSLPGLTPSLHNMFGYTARRGSDGKIVTVSYHEENKFRELLKFAINIQNHYPSVGLRLPTYEECSELLNAFIKELSKGQYTEKQVINYKDTLIKPAKYIVDSLKLQYADINTLVNKLTPMLTSIDSTGVFEGVLNTVYTNLSIVDTVLNRSDWSMVDQNIQAWSSCNNFVEDMVSIANERNYLIYIYNILSSLYERIRYKHEIFNNESLGIKQDNLSVYRIAKESEKQSLIGTVSYKTETGEVIVDLPKTLRLVSAKKAKIGNQIKVLKTRLNLITEYENAGSPPEFKYLKLEYKRFISNAISDNNKNSLITDALQLHYGHMELNKSLIDYEIRESKLEPVKIERSKVKPIIESTHERYQEWYIKVEAREFMLECLSSPEQMKIPKW